MKNLFFALLLITTFALVRPADGQNFQFAQPTYLTTPTNVLLSSNTFVITLPPLTITVSGATNPYTQFTNIITLQLAYSNSYQFVYTAGTMGTNYTTNFNNGQFIQLTLTNLTYGWAFPQSNGFNNVFVK